MRSASDIAKERRGKAKKDYVLVIAILSMIVVFLVAALPIVLSTRAVHRFNTFKKEYTDAVNHVRDYRCATVTESGMTAQVSAEKVSRLYTLMLNAGMGKEQKETPSGEPILLDLGDGVTIEFWETEIQEKSRERDRGVFIRFRKKDGFLYQFDTDQFTMSAVRTHISQSD